MRLDPPNGDPCLAPDGAVGMATGQLQEVAMPEETFVIAGAGLAGAKAAETLREEGFAGRVLLIGDEIERPYERPPLSKGFRLDQEPREEAHVHEPGWYDTHDGELQVGGSGGAVGR